MRKALTFGADSLSIIAGGLLYALLDHPGVSISSAGQQAVIPVLLVTLLLVSAAMKAYRETISENIASSMLLSIGALVLSLGVTALFLLLIDSRRLNIGILINLMVYSMFFQGAYRLALYARLALGRAAGGKKKPSERKVPYGLGAGNIGVEELLGRETASTDLMSPGAYLADSTVLVAGGAGAIGFELCSQILRQNAKLVVIFDQNESKLYETETELSLRYPKTRFKTCIGSIQDRARLREVFDLYRPQIVFHAASYRNVPITERNPNEALKNNVMGTLYMVEMAIKHRADRFVLLSDDVACKPTSILGASKRVAEMLIQRANEWGDTRFSAVRFPAAAGNAGSIIQLFNKQIQTGGPVYVSDKSVECYLMTMPEAARLILTAGGMSDGGGEIFTLGIGEPVNLYELAQSIILRNGLRPHKDISIVITGISQAEQNRLEKRKKREAAVKTDIERICVIKDNENPPVTFEEEFDKLCQSIDDKDYGSAMGKISVLVPTFQNVRS